MAPLGVSACFCALRLAGGFLQLVPIEYQRESAVMGHAKQKAAAATATPLTVTIAKATELTGISRATVYRAMADESLQTTKVRGRRLVVYESLLKLVTPDPADAAP
jgi:predicted DNA-binding transcriptional regulator AlpA